MTLKDNFTEIFFELPKFRFLKKEGIKEKNSYERRVYESVDDENLAGKMFRAPMG